MGAALCLLTHPSAALDQKGIDLACGKITELAERTMRARQNGRPLEDLLEAERKNLTPRVAEAAHAVANDAYRTPQFSDPNSREIVIAHFRDVWHLECLHDHSQTN
ncbi:hypothetical protein [Mesorhizobium sp. B2-3-4]|uniref:hypothetical protein n=1 Tax=Mesorhizobium sp. B2-3-4 TaxID=2589959 RepID=UPI00112B13F0|nr:hypothetical protein [Mesorhizobium sp. B2-3-4]TPM36879.1 hypothetical protein FJ967_17755 [Mesorhizobium sp. B2-3-4]